MQTRMQAAAEEVCSDNEKGFWQSMLAVYSFTDSANIGAIHGFSLKNYETLFTKPDLRAMIVGTLVLAIGSAFVSTVLGTFGAVGVFYSGKFGNAVVGSLNQVPVVNAEVVTAFSLCILLIGVCGVDKEIGRAHV